MRDAIGGVVNITFIAIFMVVVSAYLAFTVSNNKAFKVKNKVISILEQYEHYNPTAKEEIKAYMNKVGYNAENIDIQGWTCDLPGVCIKWTQDEESTNAGLPKGYYSVITAVDIDIPIFNKFMPYMKFFQTQGDTMTINATN